MKIIRRKGEQVAIKSKGKNEKRGKIVMRIENGFSSFM